MLRNPPKEEWLEAKELDDLRASLLAWQLQWALPGCQSRVKQQPQTRTEQWDALGPRP